MKFDLIFVFLVSVALSMLVIRITISMTHILSITDKPDDVHKLHDTSTPFVGGIGVLAALCFAFILLINYHSEHYQKCIALIVCSVIIFITGFLDDVIKLGYKLRFVIQAVVALIMVVGGGVVVHELGNLFFGYSLQLGVFGIIFTIIATIGGINALNMIDGVDGLSGSIALTSMVLMGTAAYLAQDQHNLILIYALIGGIIGFLYFNLRHPFQLQARVFLGDNGSMLLGLLFGWLLIDLSQEPNPAITPVTAIWLFSVPLMDMFGVMLRRICAGQSPFTPDWHHLHHLLMRSGLLTSEIVFSMVLLHSVLGIIGLTGFYLGFSEFAMFVGFLFISAGYFYLTYHPLRFIAMLRNFHILLNTRLGFASTSTDKVFIGNYSKSEVENLSKLLSDELGSEMNFWIRVFKKYPRCQNTEKRYAIMLNIWLDKENSTSREILRQHVTSLQRRLIEQRGIHLHQFASRKTDFDPVIVGEGSIFGEPKISSRRRLGPQALSFEIIK